MNYVRCDKITTWIYNIEYKLFNIQTIKFKFETGSDCICIAEKTCRNTININIHIKGTKSKTRKVKVVSQNCYEMAELKYEKNLQYLMHLLIFDKLFTFEHNSTSPPSWELRFHNMFGIYKKQSQRNPGDKRNWKNLLYHNLSQLNIWWIRF